MKKLISKLSIIKFKKSIAVIIAMTLAFTPLTQNLQIAFAQTDENSDVSYTVDKNFDEVNNTVNITVDAVANSRDILIESITLPDGTSVSGANASYLAEENDTFNFVIKYTVTPVTNAPVAPIMPTEPEVITPAAPEVITPVAPAAPEVITPVAPEVITPAAPVAPVAPEVIAPVAPETGTPVAPETGTPIAPDTENNIVSDIVSAIIPTAFASEIDNTNETVTTETKSVEINVEISEIMPMVAALSIGGVAIDKTNFPDADFRAYVKKQFDTTRDGFLSENEIAIVNNIILERSGVSDLTGIEHFISLNSLRIAHSELASLDLSNNKVLEKLDISYSGLPSLDLSNNKALEKLYIHYNQLESLDLSNNKVLKELSMWSNPLATLDLSKNKALTGLSIGYAQITSLDLSQNKALTILQIVDMQIPTLDLSQNKALEQLSLRDIPTAVLDLSQNIALEHLDLGKTPITALDISQNTAITNLMIWDNPIPTLDLSQNKALGYLVANSEIHAGYTNVGSEYQLDFKDIVGKENLSNIISVTQKDNTENITVDTNGIAVFTKDPSISEVSYVYNAGSTLGNLEVTIMQTTLLTTHTITATAGANGAIDPIDVTNVIDGKNQTYTITPNAGYETDTLIIDSVATTNPTNTYTFEDVKANHTIDVTFKQVKSGGGGSTGGGGGSTGGGGGSTGGGGGSTGGGGTPAPTPAPAPVPTQPIVEPAAVVPALPLVAAPVNDVANNKETTTITENAPTPNTTLEAPTDGLDNPEFGLEGNKNHNHIQLIMLLFAVWILGGSMVLRERKITLQMEGK